jgi:hypothetical protein
VFLHIVILQMKAGIFIARQRLGKQVPAEMNTHITTEELLVLCNDGVNTPL